MTSQHAQDDEEEDLVFNVEEVQKIVRDNIELVLGGNMYSHSRTPQWISIITEKTMSRLHKLNKPFKYIYAMPRSYVKGIGKRPYAYYSQETLQKALLAVRKGLTLRKAEEKYGVSRSTLNRHIHNKNTGKYGRPAVFSQDEELLIVNCIAAAGDWGFYNAGTKKAVEKRFVGKVIDAVSESHVFVKFLRKSSKVENTFIFPHVDDEQLVAPENIVMKIDPLNISRGRHLFPKIIKEYSCS